MKRSRYLFFLIVAATFALSYFLLRAADLKVVLDGRVFPIAAPWGAAITAGFVAMLGFAYQAVRRKEQRASVAGMFGNSISPEVVARMVEAGEEPKLGGRDVELTAYSRSRSSSRAPNSNPTFRRRRPARAPILRSFFSKPANTTKRSRLQKTGVGPT